MNPLSSVTSPQILLDLWFLFLSVDRFLMLYTTYLTLVYALFLVPEVLLISSPLWTEPLFGPRLFLCPQPPLRIVPVGFLGLESLPRLLLIEEHSLPLLSGLFYVLC